MDESLNLLRVSVEDYYRSLDDQDRNAQYADHWWDHISRVVRNASLICDEAISIGSDRAVILAAALCHDFVVTNDGEDDVRASSKRCRELMVDCGFTSRDADLGASLVLATDRDVREPTTTLERILYTADKLDLFGTDGTIRILLAESRKGLTVREDLAQRVRTRQAQWLLLMRSFDIAHALVEERAESAERLLESLSPIDLTL